MKAIALELADGRTISGTCDPQFAGVLAEFQTNFAERKGSRRQRLPYAPRAHDGRPMGRYRPAGHG